MPVLGYKQRLYLLKEIKESRADQLTPREQTIYKLVRNLSAPKSKLIRDTKKNRKEKYTGEKLDKYLSAKVNKPSLKFIMSQYKMQFKSPRGRRFCIDDKILALSLMKHSYKCFKHMSTLFALPSRKTLAVILGKVPFYCGLNEKIMNNLRGTVEKMEDINKHCVLLFDEISLKAGLALDKKTDSISGFENLGRYSSCAFADHALVFMARGIASKWKQPIAYFYSKHGVKSSALVHNIKDIIKSLNDIGLKVVATVCDQHATNQAAYKQLIDETNSYYLTNQLENRGFGFLVDGNEVVPLYDTPHLLKGIRNNMLDADVKFTFPGRNQQIASWNDIVNFYKYDQSLVKPCTATEFFERNQTSVFKLCHKLTDAHLYKEKMNKMKVSTAAQVFSHRVSAGMRCFKDRGNP